MITRVLVTCALVLISTLPVYAGHMSTNSNPTIILPHHETFDSTGTGTWDEEGVLTSDDCGGTARRETSGCWAGAGCLKVVPPSTGCSADQGGYVGLGWYLYSGTPTLYFQFKIYFGPTFVSKYGGSSQVIKFLLQDGGGRSGILGLNKAYSAMAWGITSTDAYYHYNQDFTDVYPEHSDWPISSGSHSQEWMLLNYKIDTFSGTTSMEIWTEAGLQHSITDLPSSVGGGQLQTGFAISYWNAYFPSPDSGTYYILDDLKISTEPIEVGDFTGAAPVSYDTGSSPNIN